MRWNHCKSPVRDAHGLSQDLVLLKLGNELADGAVRIRDSLPDILARNRARGRGEVVDVTLARQLLVDANHLSQGQRNQ